MTSADEPRRGDEEFEHREPQDEVAETPDGDDTDAQQTPDGTGETGDDPDEGYQWLPIYVPLFAAALLVPVMLGLASLGEGVASSLTTVAAIALLAGAIALTVRRANAHRSGHAADAG